MARMPEPREGKLTLEFGPDRTMVLDHLEDGQVTTSIGIEPVEGSEWQFPMFVQEVTTIEIKVKGPMRAATEAELMELGYTRYREYHIEDECCGKCPIGQGCYIDMITGA